MSLVTTIEVPKSIEAAARRLKELGPDGMLLGGGVDVFSHIRSGRPTPRVIIPLRSIPGTSYIESRGGIYIGAATTLAEIGDSRGVNMMVRPLREAVHSIGSPALRAQATIGGNLLQPPRCWYVNNGITRGKLGVDEDPAIHGDPKYHGIFETGPTRAVNGSDIAVALWALGGAIVIVTPDGNEKTVPIRKFYVEPDKDLKKFTIMEPGDIIKEINFHHLQDRYVGAFMKVPEPGSSTHSLVSAAVVFNDFWGKFSKATFAIGSVAPMPVVPLDTMERLLYEEKLNWAIIPKAAKAAAHGAKPLPGNEYKVPLLQNLMLRALTKATNDLQHGPSK